jgi:Ni/Fe-hydrogenase subunit HybB-like protein
MTNRLRATKDVLWIIALAGLVAAVFRLWFGLGATTNLSDAVPWGLWKVLNMIGGVALSTSGFTVGFLVYILRLKQFQPFMKPAILIAFLGYGCSCTALLFDIGLPQRFWHPIFMWNINSFLFEVFWCVLLYFTVTAIELAPVIFERFRAEKVARILHRIAFVVVVIGISLSSLHHSSLGSLFLVTPQRLHPLWYSPWLPLLFIVSAMGAGLMVVVLAKVLWARWYEPASIFGPHVDLPVPLVGLTNGATTAVLSRGPEGPEMPRIRSLATIAAAILSVYFVLKVADLFLHGGWEPLLAGTWESWLYAVELALTAILPILLMILPWSRYSPAGVGVAAASAALGLALNRLDVGIFGYVRDAGTLYFPSLIEWAVSLGVVAAAGLVFFFMA